MNTDNLKPGDIINIRKNSLTSFLIRLFSKSYYSHSACYVGGDLIIEADEKGVHLSYIDKYDCDEIAIFRNKWATKKQLDNAASWMCQQIGSKYDFLGVFGLVLNIFGVSKGNSLDNKKRYWCSELVADGYINAEILTCEDEKTYNILPDDFTDPEYFEEIIINFKY